MRQIISRKEAKEKGFKKYFTGKPCKNNHICERYVSGGHCIECNIDCQRQYREENREKYIEYQSKWREENPDYYHNRYNNYIDYHRQYYEENKKQKSEFMRRWREENKDKVNVLSANRRAARLNATPPWLTEEQLERIELFYSCAKENELTFGKKYHVDHIVPLQGKNVCGLHVPWNLQVLLASKNHKKSNKYV